MYSSGSRGGRWPPTPARARLNGYGCRGEACALERSDAPIGIGAQLGREGVQGLERALDRGAVGGGLRSQEANPRQRDIEGAKPPASSPVDELTRLREERAGSRAVTGGQLRVRERREDARLVPQRGASITSERERPLEHTRGRGRGRRPRAPQRRGTRRPPPERTRFRALPRARRHGGRGRARRADHPAGAAPRTGTRAFRRGPGVRARSPRRGVLAGRPQPRPCVRGGRWPAPTTRGTSQVRWNARSPPAVPATCATSVRARSAVARAGARRPTASCAWASTERISNSNIASDPSASSVARSAHARYCPTSPASPHRRP